MTYITNDCLAYFIYKRGGNSHGSPLIGSLFENDTQWVKFCKNFDYYINLEPRFGEPLLPVKIMGHENPPIMFLDDIEIHWPHEKSIDETLEKYLRRRERIKDPIFLWTDDQMFNGYSEELRQAFPGKFVMTKFIPNYRPGSLDYNKLAEYFTGVKVPDIHYDG